MRNLTRKLLPFYALLAAAVAGAAMLTALPSLAATPAQAAAALPACPFWAGDVTPPPRPVTPFIPPPQTAPALNFSTRMAPPALSGTLVNGQVNLTLSRVPGAVAYRVWRDGVGVGWVSDWGQKTLTAVDTAPCQNAFYQVVALSSNSTADSAMGDLSQPYWLGAGGTLALGPPNPAVGTTISMRVTSYNDGGQTASGYGTELGMCATDPRVIPWGTYFTVPDYGTCYAGDIGTWISDDAVDVWLPGNEAANWGVQMRTITIIADPYPVPTPPPPPPPPGGGGGSCAAPWSATATYLGGDVASYNGDNWTAKWWTYDETPGGQAGVWTDDGHCTG